MGNKLIREVTVFFIVVIVLLLGYFALNPVQEQSTSTSMYCGNGICQKGFPIGETIENCPADCSQQQQDDQNYNKIKNDLEKQKEDMNNNITLK